MSAKAIVKTRPLAVLFIVLATMMPAACDAPDEVASSDRAPAVEHALPSNPRTIVDDNVLADEMLISSWPAYGGTHYERRFSPLTDINSDNVASLEPDWYLNLPRDVGLVSTPLVVDGVLYFTGTMNVVRAVDAITGELRWEFDPEVGAALGADLFDRANDGASICRACHGADAISGGAAPDLRASAAVLDGEAFDRIVRGGALSASGMLAFAELTDDELEGLRHYIRQRAEIALR